MSREIITKDMPLHNSKQFPERIEVECQKGTRKRLQKVALKLNKTIADAKREVFGSWLAQYEH